MAVVAALMAAAGCTSSISNLAWAARCSPRIGQTCSSSREARANGHEFKVVHKSHTFISSLLTSWHAKFSSSSNINKKSLTTKIAVETEVGPQLLVNAEIDGGEKLTTKPASVNDHDLVYPAARRSHSVVFVF
jgi:hypothetical protein